MKIAKLFFSTIFVLPVSSVNAGTAAEAKEHMQAIKAEISRGENLLKTNPSVAQIGAHSNRMKALMNEGEKFHAPSSYVSCAGLGAQAWTYWYLGMLPKFNGWDKNANSDYSNTKALYKKGLAECQSAVKG